MTIPKKRFTIYQSTNGYLVVHGETPSITSDLVKDCYTFNGLDAAIAHIRKSMKGWRESANVPCGT